MEASSDAEADAVFPALLGDAGEGALGRLKPQSDILRGVAMRLLADQQQRGELAGADRKIERDAADHGDHHVQNFRRNAGKFENRQGLAIGRNAEQPAEQRGKIIAHDQTHVEHEIKPPVRLQGVDAGLEALKARNAVAIFQAADLPVDLPHDVGHCIRDRRIDGDPSVPAAA